MVNAKQQYHLVMADTTSDAPAIINALLDDFSKKGEVLHQKRNTVKKMSFQGMQVVVKSFKKPSFIQAFIYRYFRKSKACKAFKNAQEILNRGVKTPKPIAYIEYNTKFRLTDSYYISEYSEHTFDMSHVLQQFDRSDESIALIKAFTRFTFEMHERNILHIDHNSGNTLITESADGPIFTIIDINRMQFAPLVIKQRLSNFVRLTDDNVVMDIIANTYAKLAGIDKANTRKQLFQLKQAHLKKLALKRKFKHIFAPKQ